MKLGKIFRFRLWPNAEQQQAWPAWRAPIRVELGPSERQAHYQETGKSLPWAELSRRLTALKQQPDLRWLNEVDSQALQQVLADLRRAYRTSSRSAPASLDSRAASGIGIGFAFPNGCAWPRAGCTFPRWARFGSASRKR